LSTKAVECSLLEPQYLWSDSQWLQLHPDPGILNRVEVRAFAQPFDVLNMCLFSSDKILRQRSGPTKSRQTKSISQNKIESFVTFIQRLMLYHRAIAFI
jgi:hypothetical protein